MVDDVGLRPRNGREAETLNAEVYRVCMLEGGYPDAWPRHRGCPCCGGGELRSLFKKHGFNHDQCSHCGFVCVNPYPPEEIVKRLYSGTYYTNFREYYEAGYLQRTGEHSITAAPVALLEQMIARATAGRAAGEWLDVGGGMGSVANLIRQRRPGWRVVLNEFNPRSLELAREIYGVEGISEDADQLRMMAQQFDVISAISVLEHIADPLPFLRAYASLLKDTGSLALIVPQFTRLNAAISQAASPNVAPPFHVSFFNEENLRELLRQVAELAVVDVIQFGPAAFSLLHHYDVSDYWDISVPTAEEPVPKSLMTRPYPAETSIGLNALAEADRSVAEYFGKVDGRTYLMALARKHAATQPTIYFQPAVAASEPSIRMVHAAVQIGVPSDSLERQHTRELGRARGRLLVAYSNSSNYVSTTSEYLESVARWSTLDVRYVHVTHDAQLDFDLSEFDAVFQSYCARLPFDNYVSASFTDKLRTFRGVKMLAVQDEYENFGKLKSAVREIGYHVLFTNASADLVRRLYPPDEFPNTEFITVLTGYVPGTLENPQVRPRPLRERPIHLGYRCRVLPAYYGRLGFEKFEIGRRMREICEQRGIPHDIEWSDDKRLYGDAWYEFIGSCRANLGAETGCNVFDFDGAIRAKYEELSVARAGPVPFEEFCQYTDPIEAQYDIGQISPRVFEAAALRTPLVLFSGRYLGVIEPDTHYIELKKDFSNADAVLARLEDIAALEKMAERAYDRLVGSGEFSYRRFVEHIDGAIRRTARELGVPLRPGGEQLALSGTTADPGEFASPREWPTTAPHHPAVFFAKYNVQQNLLLRQEIARLNASYAGEIGRLTRALDAAVLAAARRLRRSGVTQIARTILLHQNMQRFGRKVLHCLPDRVGRRVKLTFSAFVARL